MKEFPQKKELGDLLLKLAEYEIEVIRKKKIEKPGCSLYNVASDYFLAFNFCKKLGIDNGKLKELDDKYVAIVGGNKNG